MFFINKSVNKYLKDANHENANECSGNHKFHHINRNLVHSAILLCKLFSLAFPIPIRVKTYAKTRKFVLVQLRCFTVDFKRKCAN